MTYATFSEFSVTTPAVAGYIAARRDHINPALAEQPGFVSTLLLQRIDGNTSDNVQFGLYNAWQDEVSAARWQGAPRHQEVSEYVIPLVRPISSRRYVQLPEYSLAIRPAGEAALVAISRQKVRATMIDDYLRYRRDVIHASMAEAPGFVSVNVFEDAQLKDEFQIDFRWRSAADADRYHNLPRHLGEITERMRLMVTSDLGVGTRYVSVVV